MTHTVVVGIGNSIRGDDALGLLAVRRASSSGRWPHVYFREFEETHGNLLEIFDGADRLVVVDTLTSDGGKAGEIRRLSLTDLDPEKNAPYSSHQMGLARTLDLGKRLGLSIPEEGAVLALEIPAADDFTEEITPQGQEGLQRLERALAEEIDRI